MDPESWDQKRNNMLGQRTLREFFIPYSHPNPWRTHVLRNLAAVKQPHNTPNAIEDMLPSIRKKPLHTQQSTHTR